MISRVLHWLEFKKVLLLQCLAFFAFSLLVSGLSARWIRSFPARETYDFNARKNDDDGPRIGETVDLGSFKGADGSTLADAVRGTPVFMVVVVDPHCEACKGAMDQLRGVHDQIAATGIGYFIMMFTKAANSPQYFDYANSLELGSKIFIWTTDKTPPIKSLNGMVVPSHLLIDNKGVVMDKWPGTHPDPRARQEMIRQIVSDALKYTR
ncbi:MAG: hypothetical protein M3410_08050 [Acidobacteriota bacterium]|nr:hypothetical protein [Acidobacteriota bacterium]